MPEREAVKHPVLDLLPVGNPHAINPGSSDYDRSDADPQGGQIPVQNARPTSNYAKIVLPDGTEIPLGGSGAASSSSTGQPATATSSSGGSQLDIAEK